MTIIWFFGVNLVSTTCCIKHGLDPSSNLSLKPSSNPSSNPSNNPSIPRLSRHAIQAPTRRRNPPQTIHRIRRAIQAVAIQAPTRHQILPQTLHRIRRAIQSVIPHLSRHAVQSPTRYWIIPFQVATHHPILHQTQALIPHPLQAAIPSQILPIARQHQIFLTTTSSSPNTQSS